MQYPTNKRVYVLVLNYLDHEVVLPDCCNTYEGAELLQEALENRQSPYYEDLILKPLFSNWSDVPEFTISISPVRVVSVL